VEIDYPENWANLPDIIEENLNSQNKENIMGGLICLIQLAKAFEFSIDTERQPLHLIVARFEAKVREILTQVAFQ